MGRFPQLLLYQFQILFTRKLFRLIDWHNTTIRQCHRLLCCRKGLIAAKFSYNGACHLMRPYFYRWPVETKYKELKSRLAIEEFSGATTTSVLQEFYINVLLSNLSSLIKNQVDEEIQITAKSTNKYRYQANRAFIIGRVKTIVPKILSNLFDLSAIDRLYKESLRCRSQITPGRTFRRKKNKAIGRTHFNNKKVAF